MCLFVFAHICCSRTGKVGENGQSFVLGGTSCGIRPSVPTPVRVELGLVNRASLGSLSTGSPTGQLWVQCAALCSAFQSALCSAFQSVLHCVVHFRVGSMYSQAHISLFNIYRRVWLFVIRGAEKATLGSKETFFKLPALRFRLSALSLSSELWAFIFELKMTWRKWEGSQPRLRCARGKW